MNSDLEGEDTPIPANDREAQEDHHNLTQIIAFYRYISSSSQISIKVIIKYLQDIKSLHSFGVDALYLQDFFDEKKEITNNAKAELILTKMKQLLQSLLKRKRQQNSKNKEQQKQKQKNKKKYNSKNKKEQNSSLSAHTLILLSTLFRINNQYQGVRSSKHQDIFSIDEIVQLFDCTIQNVKILMQYYKKHKELIIEKFFLKQHRCIYTIVLIKLKLIISSCLSGSEFPPETEIQQNYISLISSVQSRAKNVKQKLKYVYFSQICQGKLQIEGLRIQYREKVQAELSEILCIQMSEEKLMEVLGRIEEKFHVPKKSLLRQYRRMKKANVSTIYQTNKKFQSLSLFNYYRYKESFQFSKEVVEWIKQKEGLDIGTILKVNCQKEILLIGEEQQIIYSSIMCKILNAHMSHDQVLYIDHTQFYRHQFHLYNQLSSKISTMKTYQPFDPDKDCLFSLITGHTKDKLLFYSIVYPLINLKSYLNRIKSILNSLAERVPKFIVLYAPSTLIKEDLQDIYKFMKYFSQTERIIYLLPYRYFLNLNRYLFHYLKIRLQKELSLQVQEQDFDLLLKRQIHKHLLSAYKKAYFQQLFSLLKQQLDQKSLQAEMVISKDNGIVLFQSEQFVRPDLFYLLQQSQEDQQAQVHSNASCYELEYYPYQLQKKNEIVIFRQKLLNSGPKQDIKTYQKVDINVELYLKTLKLIGNLMINYSLALNSNFESDYSRFYRYGMGKYHHQISKTSYRRSIIYRAFTEYSLNRFLNFRRKFSVYPEKYQEQIFDVIKQLQSTIIQKNRTDQLTGNQGFKGFVNRFETDHNFHIYFDRQTQRIELWDCLNKYRVTQPVKGTKNRYGGQKTIKQEE